MSAMQRVQSGFFQLGVLGCVLLGFAIPTSRALFNIAAVLIIAGWLCSGHYATKWQVVRQSPLFWPVVGLWALLLLGATYTSAAWGDVVEHWERYSKFFLVFMVMGLLPDQRHRRWMWWAFIAACAVVLVSTYLNVFFLLPWSKSQNLGLGADHAVFIDYIAQSLVMGMFAVLLWSAAIQGPRWPHRLIWGALCLAAVFSITHLTSSRIGYGVVLVLSVLLPLLAAPKRWAWAVAIGAVAGVLALLLLADVASQRIAQVFSEAANYREGDVLTSTGARLHMWVTSWQLWMQAPWFGHGTGAYHDLAKAAFNNDTMCQVGCFHPHNQFLFFAVDHGLAGVVFFSAYLLAAVYIGWSRAFSEKTLMLGFVAIVFVDALAHGPLWLFMEAYFSFGLMALLAAGPSGLFAYRAAMPTPDAAAPAAAR